MRFGRSLVISLSLILCPAWFYAQPQDPADPVTRHQTLVNGRIWRNEHIHIKGDPFLFTTQYLDGSITIGKITFPLVKLRYDIFLDEITMPHDSIILQLNKEKVDSFSLFWENQWIQFLKVSDKSSIPFPGYVRNVYSDESFLFIKYQKKIDRPRVENTPDNFYQIQRIYLICDSLVYPVKKKRDIFQAFGMYETQVKKFIRDNNIHFSRRYPSSLIPVLKYYDSLTK